MPDPVYDLLEDLAARALEAIDRVGLELAADSYAHKRAAHESKRKSHPRKA